MNQIFTVFRFTYLDAVRKKAYRISTIIIMLLILILCLIPKVVGMFSGSDTAGTESEITYSGSLYLSDKNNLIPGGEQALAALGYQILEANENTELSDNELLVEVEKGEGAPIVHIMTSNFMSAPDDGPIVNALTTAWRFSLVGSSLTPEEFALSQSELGVIHEISGGMNLTGYSLGLVFTMLMFFAVYYYGLSVANSVAMEKTSRVMETLIISAKPKHILIGKCIAMGAAGLTQLIIIFLFGYAAYSSLVPHGSMLFGIELSFDGLTFTNTVILILYFLLGYSLYALVNAVCGASVSRIEDVSIALMPVSLISLASFYVGYFTAILGNATPAIEIIAKYVPFASPFGMPFRILNGSVTMSEIATSLGLLLVSIILLSVFCARLYAASVMFYGKRLKIRDMIRLKP